ncbi:MAG TPA: CmpA/NrtA family ABC transporter substrate-binding protein [Gammaproteobacteria bacterium]
MSLDKSAEITGPEKTRLKIGFIPLTDCVTLAVAKEMGFFRENGLEVSLSKEMSWANIRDKLAYGVLDCAQMLATMPITSTLGTAGWKQHTVTSLVLGVNGNAITVSDELYQQLKSISEDFDQARPVSADTLKKLIEIRKSRGEELLSFAHVFPTSTHNYFLRYWMASAGIDPDRDVRLIVIPPQQMVMHLEEGNIDGFCAGEPWNQYAVSRGKAHVLITSYEIWNNAPDKVLGVNREWMDSNPRTHIAVIKSLLQAAIWLEDRGHREQAAKIIAHEDYVGIPEEIILPPLLGKYKYHNQAGSQAIENFNMFFNYTAAFPWHSHAAWYIEQMKRWHDLPEKLNTEELIEAVFLVDHYRQVAPEMGIDCPLANSKQEGVHADVWEIESSQGSIQLAEDMFFDADKL